MKKLLQIHLQTEQINAVLLLVRIGIAAMMLVHGLPKMQMLIGGEAGNFPGILGMNSTLSLGLAVFAEVFCSLLILFGMGTRLATLPLIITMVVAVFYVHAADPFANQELGLHYLLAYLCLLILGSGKYSVDAMLSRQKNLKLKKS